MHAKTCNSNFTFSSPYLCVEVLLEFCCVSYRGMTNYSAFWMQGLYMRQYCVYSKKLHEIEILFFRSVICTLLFCQIWNWRGNLFQWCPLHKGTVFDTFFKNILFGRRNEWKFMWNLLMTTVFSCKSLEQLVLRTLCCFMHCLWVTRVQSFVIYQAHSCQMYLLCYIYQIHICMCKIWSGYYYFENTALSCVLDVVVCPTKMSFTRRGKCSVVHAIFI